MSDETTDLARPLRSPEDLDEVLDRVGDARVVQLGEASHGTSEFYRWRAALTRRLIAEKDFRFVAVEGDWPDCYAVNRCVRLRPGAPEQPRQVLSAFDRWPTWMWANEEVVAFANWLRSHNAEQPVEVRAGFYGLDVYSLWESMRELLRYVREHEPQHVERTLAAIRCFEPYGEDAHEYASASRFAPATCEPAVLEMLARLCERRAAVPDDGDDPEARFAAEQNAAVVAGAERYYRSMIGGSAESWNVRDTHMADTLDRLLDVTGGKGVVWAHNTHIGDARATDMARAGMVNLGQLARDRHGRDRVALVGFGSYRGGVIAAERWGGAMRRMPVPAARPGSLEHLLHERYGRDAAFVLTGDGAPSWATERLGHRAIGVVYTPERERWGNYVPTVLSQRYDAFLYFDDSAPLQPLHLEPEPAGERGTWPFAV